LSSGGVCARLVVRFVALAASMPALCGGRRMPTYEYECRKCGHRFEESQSIKAEPLTDCPRPNCKGRVRRLISTGGGLLFRGSGFYITDYRSDSYKQAAKAEKGPSSDSKSSGETTAGKSETKAAKTVTE
jgi:putative FmdB family regulatory protein